MEDYANELLKRMQMAEENVVFLLGRPRNLDLGAFCLCRWRSAA